MSELQAALVDLLRPLVREIVREEVKRAKLEWRWQPVGRAAELLGISEQAARRRVLRGQLPGRRVEGRVYVDMEKLDREIAATLTPHRQSAPARRTAGGMDTRR